MTHTCVIPLRGRIVRSIGLALFLLTVSAGWLPAQTPESEETSPWLIGASVGLPGHGSTLDPEYFTIGAHATRVESGRLGGDFAVGTMPRLLVEGVVPFGARAGLALPFAHSERVLLVPSVGGGLILALGSAGVVAETGVVMGANAFFLEEDSSGIRGGITWHWFNGVRDPIWSLEIGFVRRRAPPSK